MYELSYFRTTHFWLFTVTLNQFSFLLSTVEMEATDVLRLSKEQFFLILKESKIR